MLAGGLQKFNVEAMTLVNYGRLCRAQPACLSHKRIGWNLFLTKPSRQ
jgi:hypothetical protein